MATSGVWRPNAAPPAGTSRARLPPSLSTGSGLRASHAPGLAESSGQSHLVLGIRSRHVTLGSGSGSPQRLQPPGPLPTSQDPGHLLWGEICSFLFLIRQACLVTVMTPTGKRRSDWPAHPRPPALPQRFGRQGRGGRRRAGPRGEAPLRAGLLQSLDRPEDLSSPPHFLRVVCCTQITRHGL